MHFTYRRHQLADGRTRLSVEEHSPDARPAPDGSTFFTVFPEDGDYATECNRCGSYVGWQDTGEAMATVMWEHEPATCFDYLYSEGTEKMQLLGVLADMAEGVKD